MQQQQVMGVVGARALSWNGATGAVMQGAAEVLREHWCVLWLGSHVCGRQRSLPLPLPATSHTREDQGTCTAVETIGGPDMSLCVAVSGKKAGTHLCFQQAIGRARAPPGLVGLVGLLRG